jgi:hypothetical protein
MTPIIDASAAANLGLNQRVTGAEELEGFLLVLDGFADDLEEFLLVSDEFTDDLEDFLTGIR